MAITTLGSISEPELNFDSAADRDVALVFPDADAASEAGREFVTTGLLTPQLPERDAVRVLTIVQPKFPR